MNLTPSISFRRLSLRHIRLQSEEICLVLREQSFGETSVETARLKPIPISYFQTPQPSPKSLNVQPSPTVEDNPGREQSDSLINDNAQNVVYFGVFLLAISLITAMGMLSRKVVWSVLFALILSGLMIAVLWFF